MVTRATDLNLLFGITAVQNDFVPRDALIEAMGAWVLDKSRRLGEILVQHGHLTADRCALLDALVNEHLKLHNNDPEQSLAAAASVSSLRLQLSQIADPDLQASLQVAGSARLTDPDSTQLHVPREATTGLRYRILRPHAKGGLGEVFVAEDLELHREIALKEIQLGHAQDAVSRGRFLLEAEVTGRLEHPGIVPVYGLGQYADGRPYYAMRFIHGDNLKEAIRRFHEAEKTGRDPGERSLALRQLLGRFVDVCNAIAYAHSRGVLHRDLKPGNVMLGKYGETLVVDWGLAKTIGRTDATTTAEETTLQPSSGSGVAATQMGAAIGTPPYMSPEQAAGQLDRVGPASDVYSLGATLYTLLTGQPPFREDDAGQLLQKVQRGDFPPPREVKSAVPIPLEATCLKAMARQPEDRYPTARALATDIEHWLADEPVAAWPEPASVRAQRWARRHRPLVASAAAALLVTIVGLVVGFFIVSAAYENEYTARLSEQEAKEKALEAEGVAEGRRVEAEAQRARADANFAKAMAAVDDYMTKVSETKLLENPGMQPLREDLLTSALHFYQEFLKEREDDPNVRRAVAAANLRVARILNSVGERQAAQKASSTALGQYEELAKQYPTDDEVQHGLAEAYSWNGKYSEAIAIWRKLLQDRADDVKFLQGLADALNSLAADYRRKGELSSAISTYQDALAEEDRLIQIIPNDPEMHGSIAITLHCLGNILSSVGNENDSLAMYQRAAQHHEIAYALMPGLTYYGENTALALETIAGKRASLNQHEEALDAYRRALEIRQKLAAENPAVPGLRQSAYKPYSAIARLLRNLGRLQEAAEASQTLQAYIEAVPTKTSAHLYDLACVRARNAEWIGADKNELTDAEKRQREQLLASALQTLEEAVSQGYDNAEWATKDEDLATLRDRPEFIALTARMEQIAQARKLAKDAKAAETPAEKLKANEQAQAVLQNLVEQEPANLRHQVDLAYSLYAAGMAQRKLREYAPAEQSLTRALALNEELVQQSPETVAYRRYMGAIRIELGIVQWLTGRHQEADLSWNEGIKLCEACIKEEPEKEVTTELLSRKMIGIGEEYAKLALWQEATELFSRAFELHAPDDAWQWLHCALLLSSNRDYAAYRTLCKRAVERFGIVAQPPYTPANDPTALAFLYSCGPETGVDRKEAARLAETGLTIEPKNASRNFIASLAYTRGEDVEKAFQTARQAVEVSASSQCIFTLALAHHHRGDRAEAVFRLEQGERAWEDELRNALERPYPSPVTSYGWMLSEYVIVDREAHMAIRGIAAPDLPWMRLIQGRVRAHMGKSEMAEKDFAAAIEARPNDPQVWIARGRIFAELGQPDRAEADLAQAIALAPSDAQCWIARGRHFAEQGRHKEAEENYGKAAELSANELNVFPESGWWVAGPYPVDMNTRCSPEENQSPEMQVAEDKTQAEWETKWLQWHPLSTEGHGLVNFFRVFPSQPGQVAAGSYYSLCYVASPDERSIHFHVGCQSPICIWLNEELVHDSTTPKSFNVPDIVPVKLQQGINKVLVKVSCTANFHNGFFLRIDDSLEDRAYAFAKRGLSEEAAGLLAKANEKTAFPNHQYVWHQVEALLFAGRGTVDQSLLARFGEQYTRSADPYIRLFSTHTLIKSRDFDATTIPLVSLAEAGNSIEGMAPYFVSFHIAWANYRVGNYQEALSLAKNLETPDFPSNDMLVAMASFKLGEKEEAERRLKKAEDWYLQLIRSGLQSPNSVVPYDWNFWGTIQILYREAKTLIEGKPYADEPLWLIATGRERALLGLNERAEQDFQEAMTIRPEDPEVWAWRGRLAQLGRYAEAAADFDRAQQLAKVPKQWSDLSGICLLAARSIPASVQQATEPAKFREVWLAAAVTSLQKAVDAGVSDPANPLVGKIAFEFDESDEGWQPLGNVVSNVKISEGAYSARITNENSYLTRPNLLVRGDSCAVVIVRARVTAGKDGRFYWATESSPGFAEERVVRFPMQDDGDWHEYRLEVAAHKLWAGQIITALRLDPGNAASSEFAIDYIRGVEQGK